MSQLEEFLFSLPDQAHDRGKAFEVASLNWLKDSSIWGSITTKVWPWSSWPGRWNSDAGIDIVIEVEGGDLWAVQCKAYATDRSLTKRDIDTFLSESSSDQFAGRLVIATCGSISSTLAKTIAIQSKPVKLALYPELSLYEHWGSPQQTREKAPVVLRDYQNEAIKAISNELKTANRTQLIMACGTGKTPTSLGLWEELTPKTTLYLVPSLFLLSQTLSSWLGSRKKKFDWLAVCSDETVTSDSSGKLLDYSFPATTDVSEIEEWLLRPGEKVIFCTYQSMANLEAALKRSKVSADLVLADEAHRLAGSSTKTGSSLLSDATDVFRKIVFMTATPRVFRSNDSDTETPYFSMDDERAFGKIGYKYGFAEAIREGWLTNYRLVAVAVENAEVPMDLVSTTVTIGDEAINGLEYSALRAIQQAVEDFSLSRLVSFHRNVARARAFASSLSRQQWDGRQVFAEAVDGTQSAGIRRAAMDRLSSTTKNQVRVVSNARCLTEGIDVPSLDGVIFVDPKYSQVDIVQAVGRAIRLNGPHKSEGIIILPFVINTDESAKTAIEESAFSPIAAVINALCSHDETLLEEMNLARRAIGRGRTSHSLPSRIQIHSESPLDTRVMERIRLELIGKSSTPFEEWYGKLLSFFETFQHLEVPITPAQSPEFYELGRWLNKQRQLFKRGLMSEYRSRLLSLLDPMWFDPHESSWKAQYAALKKHAQITGSCWVPKTNGRKGPANPLGTFLAKQVGIARAGKMKPERLKLLEALPGWTLSRRDDGFDEMLSQCINSANAFGGALRIPTDLVLDNGMSPYSWMRKFGKEPRIEIRKRLREIPGFYFISENGHLIEGLKELERFVEKNRRIPKGGEIEIASTGRDLASTSNRIRQVMLQGSDRPVDEAVRRIVAQSPLLKEHFALRLYRRNFRFSLFSEEIDFILDHNLLAGSTVVQRRNFEELVGGLGERFIETRHDLTDSELQALMRLITIQDRGNLPDSLHDFIAKLRPLADSD